MKTQLSKPAGDRARYTNQYKQEALELWRASGRSAAKVAAELGIRPPLLYRWARTERVSDAPPSGRRPRRSLGSGHRGQSLLAKCQVMGVTTSVRKSFRQRM